jgi:3'(2'), 5'-bisphosphate nucleotidase
MSLAPSTREALAALRAACRVCRAVSAGTITSVTKSDDSPVTVADLASQAVIVSHLRRTLGEVVIVGEESADTLRADPALAEKVVDAARVAWPDADIESVIAAIDSGNSRPDGGAYWTLDPIDGTKGFVRREQYAVCLSYVERGVPTVGLLGCPNLPRDQSAPLDAAAPDGSIYVVEADGPVRELAVDASLTGTDGDPVPTATKLEGELVVTISVESGHTRQDHVEQLLARLGRPSRTVRCDSQAKYALVARGQAHEYLRVPTKPDRFEMVWDHASGVAIASRTGMRVTDLRGATLDFSTPPLLRRNYGILCAHPDVHGELLAAIAALGYAG